LVTGSGSIPATGIIAEVAIEAGMLLPIGC
jgi:hypothetical protein